MEAVSIIYYKSKGNNIMTFPKQNKEIWHYLDLTFSYLLPHELSKLSNEIDNMIPHFLIHYIVPFIAGSQANYIEGSPYIYKENKKFQVIASPDLFQSNILSLAITEIGISLKGKRPKKKTIKIKGISLYSTVHVYIPTVIKVDNDVILEEISLALSSIDAWLLEKIRLSVKIQKK